MPSEYTPELIAAANFEIDIIPANEVGDDILAELDQWSEIGWVLLECGCLVGPEGFKIHGHLPEEDPPLPPESPET